MLRSGKQTGELTIDSTIGPQTTGEMSPNEKVKSKELVDASEKEVPQIVTHMPNVRPSKLSTQPKVSAQSDELLFKKKKLSDMETIALIEGCSAFLTNKLPPKMKDPALCDLGASINLMPLSTFRKFGIGHMKPTVVALQLADQSLAQPEEQIKDILVHVDKFIFSADFIILDYEAGKEVPVILGRPFLAIRRTLIDIYKGELTMRLNDEHVTFNIF
ncbi:uncharacterized protein LOC105771967 [Gossypium raimondii]|uniref:uncharacterized protein LOC105771967 n=1 Tax=Gossypium raimondii TaxID=29730 RepID=UPI00227C2127|nr:uncharacterized protein LOC105771967 [Gossypium raimondii]